jgi:uncharacterized membrane protein
MWFVLFLLFPCLLFSHIFALIIGLVVFYVFAKKIHEDCKEDHTDHDDFTEHVFFAVGILISIITILENIYVYHGYAVIRPCLLLWL